MRSQVEKNKEILMEYIEKHAEDEMNQEIAMRLSNAHGAYKALCMAGNSWAETDAESRAAEKSARTPELDGDTEFERVLMQIPMDTPHIKAIFNIFADHMEQLGIIHHKSYDNLMLKLREVAQN